jgi:hypothetical protein
VKTPLVILALVLAIAVAMTIAVRYFGFNVDGYAQ